MKRFLLTYPLLALLAGLVLFSSCKKSNDPAPKPTNNGGNGGNNGSANGTYGGVTWGNKNYAFNISEADVDSTDNYSYTLATAVSATGTSDMIGMAVYLTERPTATKEYTLGEENLITIVSKDSGSTDTQIHVYNDPTQKVKATVSGGKVTVTFTNLNETLVQGGPAPNGRKLSGTMKEK